jgi:hypothetical protein
MDGSSPFEKSTRRQFFGSAAVAGALFLPAALVLPAEENEGEEDVSTNEDLMREHGILKRVLIAYDEIIRRIRAGQDFPPQTVTDGATIIRKFIEEYHEKLEEDHLFPRFRKAGKLVDLVTVLLAQHQAGRRVTARILATASGSLKSADDRTAWPTILKRSTACTRRTRPEKTRYCSRRCTRSFPSMSTTLWASSSKRSNGKPSAATASTSTLTKSRTSKSASAFTTSRSSRPRNAPWPAIFLRAFGTRTRTG